MIDSRTIFEAVVLSVVLAAILVAGRLALSGFVACRARRHAIVVVSVAWFAYGVAHTGKDLNTFLNMLLFTAVPYVLGLLGLWLLGGALASRLRSSEAQPGKMPQPAPYSRLTDC